MDMHLAIREELFYRVDMFQIDLHNATPAKLPNAFTLAVAGQTANVNCSPREYGDPWRQCASRRGSCGLRTCLERRACVHERELGYQAGLLKLGKCASDLARCLFYGIARVCQIIARCGDDTNAKLD